MRAIESSRENIIKFLISKGYVSEAIFQKYLVFMYVCMYVMTQKMSMLRLINSSLHRIIAAGTRNRIRFS